MKQLSFADAEYAGKRKQTRRERFLIEMDQVVPWQALMALINSIGPAIDEKTAKAHLYNLHYQGLMDARSAKIMESALTGWNQHGVDEQVLDQIRARQFKQMLLAYIN